MYVSQFIIIAVLVGVGHANPEKVIVRENGNATIVMNNNITDDQFERRDYVPVFTESPDGGLFAGVVYEGSSPYGVFAKRYPGRLVEEGDGGWRIQYYHWYQSDGVVNQEIKVHISGSEHARISRKKKNKPVKSTARPSVGGSLACICDPAGESIFVDRVDLIACLDRVFDICNNLLGVDDMQYTTRVDLDVQCFPASVACSTTRVVEYPWTVARNTVFSTCSQSDADPYEALMPDWGAGAAWPTPGQMLDGCNDWDK